jgi:hypothetical protein
MRQFSGHEQHAAMPPVGGHASASLQNELYIGF